MYQDYQDSKEQVNETVEGLEFVDLPEKIGTDIPDFVVVKQKKKKGFFSSIFHFLLMLLFLVNIFTFISLKDKEEYIDNKMSELKSRERQITSEEKRNLYVAGVLDTKEEDLKCRALILQTFQEILQNQSESLAEKQEILDKEQDFIYEMVNEITSSKNIYIPSPQEIENLQYLLFAEAGNQSYEGQLAVAEVVFNRIRDDSFPNNINDVIFEKNQFSPCYDGKVVRLHSGRAVNNEDVNSEIEQAVFEAWSGSNLTEMLLLDEAETLGIDDPKYWYGGALYFANLDSISESCRNSIKEVPVRVNIQNHNFRRVY